MGVRLPGVNGGLNSLTTLFSLHLPHSYHVIFFQTFSVFASIQLAFIMPRTPRRSSRGHHGLCKPTDSLSTQHTEHPPPLSLNTPSCPSAISTSSIVNTPSSSVMTYPSDFEARPRYVMKAPRVITREERLDFEQYNPLLLLTEKQN